MKPEKLTQDGEKAEKNRYLPGISPTKYQVDLPMWLFTRTCSGGHEQQLEISVTFSESVNSDPLFQMKTRERQSLK